MDLFKKVEWFEKLALALTDETNKTYTTETIEESEITRTNGSHDRLKLLAQLTAKKK